MPASLPKTAAAGDCQKCGVALAAVLSEGGSVCAWQCPLCHKVSASRMPELPRGATTCPVCLRVFTSVRRHWAHGAGWKCGKFYAQGMIWSKGRPAWASHAEGSGA